MKDMVGPGILMIQRYETIFIVITSVVISNNIEIKCCFFDLIASTFHFHLLLISRYQQRADLFFIDSLWAWCYLFLECFSQG